MLGHPFLDLPVHTYMFASHSIKRKGEILYMRRKPNSWHDVVVRLQLTGFPSYSKPGLVCEVPDFGGEAMGLNPALTRLKIPISLLISLLP